MHRVFPLTFSRCCFSHSVVSAASHKPSPTLPFVELASSFFRFSTSLAVSLSLLHLSQHWLYSFFGIFGLLQHTVTCVHWTANQARSTFASFSFQYPQELRTTPSVRSLTEDPSIAVLTLFFLFLDPNRWYCCHPSSHATRFWSVRLFQNPDPSVHCVAPCITSSLLTLTKLPSDNSMNFLASI